MKRYALLTFSLGLVALVCTGCPPASITPSSPTVPHATLPAVSKNDPLKSRLEAAIDSVIHRDLEVSHGFWTVFHAILGLGPEVMLIDRGSNQHLKALDYVRSGKPMPGLNFDARLQGVDVLNATDADRYFAQGHQDQFVAEMAQWRVPLELPFTVKGKDYHFADFLQFSKARASLTHNQELAWAIHIIGEYDGTDATWTNMYGEHLTLEDLIKYELDSPIDPEESVKRGQLPLSCGGTHRLFGLSWVLHLQQQKAGQLKGVWKDAQERLNELKKVAHSFQNEDGSLSTNWFVRKGNDAESSQRLFTTGHTLEWLALAISDEELRDPWIEQAVSYMCQLFLELQSQPIEGGAMYHAVHGLTIYYARRYGTEKLGPYTPYLHLAPGCKPVVRAMH